MITMARFTRLLLVLGSMAGFSTASPAPSQAGVIPWVYDAVFGPVGSLRYGTGYAPAYGYTAGYPSYSGYSSYYAPVSTAYAPTLASAGGCSTCSQAAYYPSTAYSSYYGDPYASYGSNCNCGSCGTCSGGTCSGGNCSSGNCSSGNCSSGNCNGSNTVGYPTPIPDKSSGSSDVNHRLNEIEHTQRQLVDFLKKEFQNFDPKPSTTNKTYTGNEDFGGAPGDTVKPRPKSNTFTSEPNPYKDEDMNFDRPRTRGIAPGGDPIDTKKPTIAPPPTGDEKPEEAEPKTTKIDVQITRRPVVAPRERIATSKSTPASGKVASSKSNTNRPKSWMDSSVAGQVSRQ